MSAKFLAGKLNIDPTRLRPGAAPPSLSQTGESRTLENVQLSRPAAAKREFWKTRLLKHSVGLLIRFYVGKPPSRKPKFTGSPISAPTSSSTQPRPSKSLKQGRTRFSPQLCISLCASSGGQKIRSTTKEKLKIPKCVHEWGKQTTALIKKSPIKVTKFSMLFSMPFS